MRADRFREVLVAANLPSSVGEVAEVLWLAAQTAGRPAGAPPPQSVPPPGPGERDQSPAVTPAPGPPPTPPAEPLPPQPLPTPRDTAREVFQALVGPRGEVPALGTAVGRAPALYRRLEFHRALRPLHVRVPSHRRDVVDETATAEAIADQPKRQRRWVPEMRPSSERWLDLALVVDSGESMYMWRDLSGALAGAFMESGVFRDVRVWQLRSDASVAPVVTASGRDEAVPAGAVLNAPGRQAVLVLSDCTGPGWRSGQVPGIVRRWATRAAVAIAQPLPERLWSRTAAPTIAGTASLPMPGAPNSQLRFVPYEKTALPDVPPIPVLELKPGWLNRWARVVAHSSAQPAAVTYLPERPPVRRAPPSEPGWELRRVVHFRSVASPEAYRLAGYLAIGRPTLDVMRLIHHVMVPDPQPAHLAEVLLSGLLRVRHRDGGVYEFVSERISGYLLDTVSREDFRQVTGRVSAQLEAWAGRAAQKFPALVADRAGTGQLPVGATPFAWINSDALSRMHLFSAPGVPGDPPAAGPSGLAALLSVRQRLTAAHELLHPWVATVGFLGREAELAELVAWCVDEGPPYRLLVGAAGEGKSRLAAQLVADRAAQGWYAGRLLAGTPIDELRSALADRDAPTLLVIDEADLHRDRTEAVATTVAELLESGPRIRLLCVARSAGRWWDPLRVKLGPPARRVGPNRLGPLAGGPQDRATMFAAAVRDLATTLGGLEADTGSSTVDWAAVARGVSAPDLTTSALSYAAGLLTRALATLASAAGRAGQPVLDAVLRDAVDHEQHYAAWSAIAGGVSYNTESVLDQCVAAVNLFRAREPGDARLVVRAALNLGEHDYEVANLFATWLHQLYPGRTDDDYWGGVEADEVAELLLRLRPEQCPTVAGVLGEVGKAQRDRALRTLAGYRGDNPPLGDAVRAVLRARPALAVAAIQAAGAGDTPMAEALRRGGHGVLANPATSRDDLRTMLDQLAGGEWIASFDTVADVEALVTNLRPLAQETIRYRPHLALALRQEGRLHSQAGHHGRALDRFTEAVDLYRELVTRNPGYRQALARTLTSAARQLRYLNQRAEAAEYDVEAQRLLRDLDVEGGAQPAG